MRKLVFTIDGYKYPHIGYTTGRRWNGWATPNFEADEAFAVMREFNETAETPMYYNEETDTFYVNATEYNDADEWKGRNCQTEDGLKHLYGIGAFSWVWEDINEQDIYSVALEIAVFFIRYIRIEIPLFAHINGRANKEKVRLLFLSQIPTRPVKHIGIINIFVLRCGYHHYFLC